MEKIKILFVCMGNICRSPTAEGVFAKLLQNQQLEAFFSIDSAGTHAYHVGEEPDPRSQKAARERGVDLSNIRARKVVFGDFEDFDFVLAMDDKNFDTLISACPEDHHHKVYKFLDFAPEQPLREVPDPYYGGSYGFERVLDLVEAASEGLLENLRQQGKIPSSNNHY